MNRQEYTAWERNKGRMWEEPTTPKDFKNYEGWCATRYTDNPSQYWVLAKHELGHKFTHYATRGRWQGATEWENQQFDSIQMHYIKMEGIKILRTEIDWSCKMFEILRYDQPLGAVLLVDNSRTWTAKPSKLKNGYRFRFRSI